MEDETETPGGLPGNQGQPGMDGATGRHKPPIDRGIGGGTPAPDPAPREAENGEMDPGQHQVQAGMRS